MATKVFAVCLFTFVAWISINNNGIFTAAKTQPYRDSFVVLRSNNLTQTELLELIFDAENARVKHGTNLSGIAAYMHQKFYERHGWNSNCFANIGPISGQFYAVPKFVYLKSDTSDNMYIVCYRSIYVPGQGEQLIQL